MTRCDLAQAEGYRHCLLALFLDTFLCVMMDDSGGPAPPPPVEGASPAPADDDDESMGPVDMDEMTDDPALAGGSQKKKTTGLLPGRRERPVRVKRHLSFHKLGSASDGQRVDDSSAVPSGRIKATEQTVDVSTSRASGSALVADKEEARPSHPKIGLGAGESGTLATGASASDAEPSASASGARRTRAHPETPENSSVKLETSTTSSDSHSASRTDGSCITSISGLTKSSRTGHTSAGWEKVANSDSESANSGAKHEPRETTPGDLERSADGHGKGKIPRSVRVRSASVDAHVPLVVVKPPVNQEALDPKSVDANFKRATSVVADEKKSGSKSRDVRRDQGTASRRERVEDERSLVSGQVRERVSELFGPSFPSVAKHLKHAQPPESVGNLHGYGLRVSAAAENTDSPASAGNRLETTPIREGQLVLKEVEESEMRSSGFLMARNAEAQLPTYQVPLDAFTSEISMMKLLDFTSKVRANDEVHGYKCCYPVVPVKTGSHEKALLDVRYVCNSALYRMCGNGVYRGEEILPGHEGLCRMHKKLDPKDLRTQALSMVASKQPVKEKVADEREAKETPGKDALAASEKSTPPTCAPPRFTPERRSESPSEIRGPILTAERLQAQAEQFGIATPRGGSQLSELPARDDAHSWETRSMVSVSSSSGGKRWSPVPFEGWMYKRKESKFLTDAYIEGTKEEYGPGEKKHRIPIIKGAEGFEVVVDPKMGRFVRFFRGKFPYQSGYIPEYNSGKIFYDGKGEWVPINAVKCRTCGKEMKSTAGKVIPYGAICQKCQPSVLEAEEGISTVDGETVPSEVDAEEGALDGLRPIDEDGECWASANSGHSDERSEDKDAREYAGVGFDDHRPLHKAIAEEAASLEGQPKADHSRRRAGHDRAPTPRKPEGEKSPPASVTAEAVFMNERLRQVIAYVEGDGAFDTEEEAARWLELQHGDLVEILEEILAEAVPSTALVILEQMQLPSWEGAELYQTLKDPRQLDLAIQRQKSESVLDRVMRLEGKNSPVMGETADSDTAVGKFVEVQKRRLAKAQFSARSAPEVIQTNLGRSRSGADFAEAVEKAVGSTNPAARTAVAREAEKDENEDEEGNSTGPPSLFTEEDDPPREDKDSDDESFDDEEAAAQLMREAKEREAAEEEERRQQQMIRDLERRKAEEEKGIKERNPDLARALAAKERLERERATLSGLIKAKVDEAEVNPADQQAKNEAQAMLAKYDNLSRKWENARKQANDLEAAQLRKEEKSKHDARIQAARQRGDALLLTNREIAAIRGFRFHQDPQEVYCNRADVRVEDLREVEKSSAGVSGWAEYWECVLDSEEKKKKEVQRKREALEAERREREREKERREHGGGRGPPGDFVCTVCGAKCTTFCQQIDQELGCEKHPDDPSVFLCGTALCRDCIYKDATSGLMVCKFHRQMLTAERRRKRDAERPPSGGGDDPPDKRDGHDKREHPEPKREKEKSPEKKTKDKPPPDGGGGGGGDGGDDDGDGGDDDGSDASSSASSSPESKKKKRKTSDEKKALRERQLVNTIRDLADVVAGLKGDGEKSTKKNTLKELITLKSTDSANTYTLQLKEERSVYNDQLIERWNRHNLMNIDSRAGDFAHALKVELEGHVARIKKMVEDAEDSQLPLLRVDWQVQTPMLQVYLLELVSKFPSTCGDYMRKEATAWDRNINPLDCYLYLYRSYSALYEHAWVAAEKDWRGHSWANEKQRFLRQLPMWKQKGDLLVKRGNIRLDIGKRGDVAYKPATEDSPAVGEPGDTGFIPGDVVTDVAKKLHRRFEGFIVADYKKAIEAVHATDEDLAAIRLHRLHLKFMEEHWEGLMKRENRMTMYHVNLILNTYELECRACWIEDPHANTNKGKNAKVDDTKPKGKDKKGKKPKGKDKKGKGKGKGKGDNGKNVDDTVPVPELQAKVDLLEKKLNAVGSGKLLPPKNEQIWKDIDGVRTRMNADGTTVDRRQFWDCNNFKKGECWMGKRCPYNHKIGGAKQKKGKGKGKGKNDNKPKKTPEEVKAMMAKKPCPLLVTTGSCSVKDCPFNHDKEKAKNHKNTECIAGAKCSGARSTYSDDAMKPFWGCMKCTKKHWDPVAGKWVFAHKIEKKKPKTADHCIVCPPPASSEREQLPSGAEGGNGISVDAVKTKEVDPLDNYANYYPRNEQKSLESAVKVDSGAGIHTAPIGTFVMENGKIRIKTVVGEDDRALGVSDIFPVGERPCCEADRALYAMILAFQQGDWGGFYWFPNKDDIPKDLLPGPPMMVDKKDGKQYAGYLDDGQIMMPNNIERAKELTEKMIARNKDKSSKKEPRVDSVLQEGFLEEPEKPPELTAEIPLRQWEQADEGEDEMLKQNWEDDLFYDPEEYGPEQTQDDFGMPDGLRPWDEEDPTGTLTDGLKKTIETKIGMKGKPKYGWFASQVGGPEVNVPQVIIPFEQHGDCFDVAVVYNEKGRPCCNHAVPVKSSDPFTLFKSDESELFVRVYGRKPEQEDNYNPVSRGSAQGRTVERRARFVDGASTVSKIGHSPSLLKYNRPIPVDGISLVSRKDVRSVADVKVGTSLEESTAAQDGSTSSKEQHLQNEKSHSEQTERCDDCGANNCELRTCFMPGCGRKTCVQTCAQPVGDAEDNAWCRRCYNDIISPEVNDDVGTGAEQAEIPWELWKLDNVEYKFGPGDLVFVGGDTRIDNVVQRDVETKLVGDLAREVQGMNDEIAQQTVRLEKNSGTANPTQVDSLSDERLADWKKYCKDELGVEYGVAPKSQVFKAVRENVLKKVSSRKRLKVDPNVVLFGGTKEETTAASMQRNKQTGWIPQAEFKAGHWHVDAIPLSKAPTWVQGPNGQPLLKGVGCFYEPATGCVFVRGIRDLTAEAVFELVPLCRVRNGAFEVLSGDSARIFTGCDDLYDKYKVTKEPHAPEKQNRNKAEPAWKSVSRQMRGRMNSHPKPPLRAWPQVLQWSEASLNIMSGAWAIKHGLMSWQHAVRNLCRYGKRILVYHTAGVRNESTFGPKGRPCAYVAPSPCGGVWYTEWVYIVGGGRRLAEPRVTADWRPTDDDKDYFEGFAADQQEIVEKEAMKEIPRRKRGKPKKVTIVDEAKTKPKPKTKPLGPQVPKNEGARGVDSSMDEAYEKIFEESIDPIHPREWDTTIDSMYEVYDPAVRLDASDTVLLKDGNVVSVDLLMKSHSDWTGQQVDVVQNLGMKKALSSNPWFTTGLTHEQVFRPAVYDEWKNSFESTGSFLWDTIKPFALYQEDARDATKYPDGLIDLNLHFLAGVKGFEHGEQGLAEKHGGKPDKKSPLFKLAGKTKPKVRAVINTEKDILTGATRDGRLPGETFVSRIPSASTSLCSLYYAALTQKSILVIDETSAYPSVDAGGVPAVCRLPDFAWEFAAQDHPEVKKSIEYWQSKGYSLSDLRVRAPKANYGRQRSGFVYEEAAAKAKREIGFEHGGVRGLHIKKQPKGRLQAHKTIKLNLSGETVEVTGTGEAPFGGETCNAYVDDDLWGLVSAKSVEDYHRARGMQPRSVEDVHTGASHLGTQVQAYRRTEAQLHLDNRQRCRDHAASRGIEIDEANMLEPELETVTLITRSQEPLKNKLISEFEAMFGITLEVQENPLPSGFGVSRKDVEYNPGRFAETAPKWLGMSGYVAMHTHASDPLQYGQCVLGSVTTRWSDKHDLALLHFLGYLKGVQKLRSWSIWSSRDQRLGLMWAQLVSDASHAGHEDLTSHAGCDFFLCGPNSRGHVEGHSSRLKRQFGASSEVEAAGLMQVARRSAPMLDSLDNLLEYRCPIEALLDAQVVIRQVSFGADGKVLSSLRRFHALDLGQLRLWGLENDCTLGWWGGNNVGFTTDGKTKSKPTDRDNPNKNRFFLLRRFDELGATEEGDRIADLQ